MTRSLSPSRAISLPFEVVSTVACGGNALINVGPTADGTIAPIFQERLTQLGAWLGVNGDAIYATQPWRAQNETAADVWYTQSADGATVFATALSWPTRGDALVLTLPVTSDGTTVKMLGLDAALPWTSLGASGLTIDLSQLEPRALPLPGFAWSFALTSVA